MTQDNDNDPCLRIGQLNGKWSILFRALMAAGAVVMPFLIAWCIWATTQLYALERELHSFMAHGPRYTSVQAAYDRLEERNYLLQYIAANYPPEHLTDEVDSLSRRVTTLETHHAREAGR